MTRRGLLSQTRPNFGLQRTWPCFRVAWLQAVTGVGFGRLIAAAIGLATPLKRRVRLHRTRSEKGAGKRKTIMAATVQSAITTPATPSTLGPVAASERLRLLDILRGFAILGMIIVHFSGPDTVTEAQAVGGPTGATIFQAMLWFVHEKAATTFTILFGVGFAIQLRRADARREDVRWRFLRRLLGVAAFGVVTAALAGAVTLIGYAYAGVWLLFVRRWSTRALGVALLASTTLIGVWNVAVGSYQWATIGVERANAVYESPRPVPPANQAADERLRAARQGTNFARLAAANVVSSVYWGPYTDLRGDWQRGIRGALLDSLNGPFPFFLIGLLALRLGVFERPADHRRLLVAAMLVGAALWAIDIWALHQTLWPWLPVIPGVQVARPIYNGFVFGSEDGVYLSLTYIGAITWLVGFSKASEHRLDVIFGAAGRLALTNYILQFAVRSVLLDQYGFGVRLTPQLGAVAAVILFGTLAAFSRWWIARFRLGPAEWVLRSLTYARLQPLRWPAAQAV